VTYGVNGAVDVCEPTLELSDDSDSDNGALFVEVSDPLDSKVTEVPMHCASTLSHSLASCGVSARNMNSRILIVLLGRINLKYVVAVYGIDDDGANRHVMHMIRTR
jgi:hypothetical protein